MKEIEPILWQHDMTRLLPDVGLVGGKLCALACEIGWRNDHATVVVSDNGRGISPQHLPNIFRPFYTTKGEGTGLSLAPPYRGRTSWPHRSEQCGWKGNRVRGGASVFDARL